MLFCCFAAPSASERVLKFANCFGATALPADIEARAMSPFGGARNPNTCMIFSVIESEPLDNANILGQELPPVILA
jgi:hypothetical protein